MRLFSYGAIAVFSWCRMTRAEARRLLDACSSDKWINDTVAAIGGDTINKVLTECIDRTPDGETVREAGARSVHLLDDIIEGLKSVRGQLMVFSISQEAGEELGERSE